MENGKKKVFVGLSGGVDSSVAALLLKEQGYDVTGVYMKNWSKSLPGFPCPWREDYQDAKRVAVQLGIPFLMFDFEKDYFDKVVQYMLDGFRAGITPNPDIMCNQEIKFKLFLDACLDHGADFIATGHYASVEHVGALPAIPAELGTPQSSRRFGMPKPQVLVNRTNEYVSLRSSAQAPNSTEPQVPRKVTRLIMAADTSKDQTYFLYRIKSEALARTLFPLGGLKKTEVREIAKRAGLVTANKKESMGICFVGKVGIKEFLQNYVDTEPGDIKDQNGVVVGEHDGAIFYTIGQRHGLNVGGGLPYYVTGKNMEKNEVYVTSKIDDESLWEDKAELTSIHWINEPLHEGAKLKVRTRHRGELINATLQGGTLQFEQPQRALTPGQSAVFYLEKECLGGGIIT